MSNNEFNGNNINKSIINNFQCNNDLLIPINNCVESKSKNLGNYYFYLILDIVALIANATTIISFFKSQMKTVQY